MCMRTASAAVPIFLAVFVLASPQLSIANGGDPDSKPRSTTNEGSLDIPSVEPGRPGNNSKIDLSTIPTDTWEACKGFSILYHSLPDEQWSSEASRTEASKKLKACLKKYFP